ncbi:MAG: hypothetical protein B0A82_08310 [Alkalinema sp. CACIAM 70d]|nr:MAG: hypothetical protein B0A82_08310 [Alkalinema sp. CACIAM 70d]
MVATPGKLVILKLEGDLKLRGFRVTLEIGMENDRPSIEMVGELPAALELSDCWENWDSVYHQLAIPSRIVPQAIIYGGSVNRLDECRQVSRALRDRFTAWLETPSFQKLDRRLRDVLNLEDSIRVLIRTDDSIVQHLPWHFWDFIERYPRAEVALGATTFEQYPVYGRKVNRRVRILAILGDRRGIDIEADRQMLERLPSAEVTFLVEPKRDQINDQLWDQTWDILFFAGHSQTKADQGLIQINPEEWLGWSELEYGVRQAIERGLKLAIFNSCDGLGLANQLASLHLPQMIVMRESVPDKVAQEFLKSFLTAFVRGDSLYLAERRARERLQGLESNFPCASWIPIIFQNSVNPPPTWAELLNPPQRSTSLFNGPPMPQSWWSKLKLPLVSSWVITSIVMGARLTGLLEPTELFAYDRMIVSRPTESPDPRLLIITNDEADIRYQKQQQMPMNSSALSDKALALLMKKLAPHRPVAVGLDIYRDDVNFPQEHELKQHLKDLTFICQIEGGKKGLQEILPPKKIPLSQLGFSNLPKDLDNVVRRNTIGMYGGLHCTDKSFSYQLTMRYLKSREIQAEYVPGLLQIGDRVFPALANHQGGYHRSGYIGGHEILLNFRRTNNIAPTLSLAEVLQGKYDRELSNLVSGRIILIGTTARSFNDYHDTPYGEMAGVIVHAHMISQMLSAVLDHRVLFWQFSQWLDAVVIWLWGVVGVLLGLCLRSGLLLALSIVSVSGGLVIIYYGILLQGGWMPLIPSILTLATTSSSVTYLKSKL